MKNINVAVILAAGMGSRLKSVTKDEIPKGLIKVNGKSLVERSIEKLRSVGIKKIYIVTGHLNHFYDEFAKGKGYIQTIKNRRYRTTGSMGSLAVLKDEIKEDFLLLEGDLIYEVYALIKAIEFPKQDCVLLSGKTNSGDECYVEVRDENLYKISKDKTEIENVYGELVGISKISFDLFKEMIIENKKKTSRDRYWYDCDVVESNSDTKNIKKYDYENAIFDVAKNRKVGYLKIENLIWAEIDDSSHLERVNKFILPKLEKNIEETLGIY